MPINNDTFLSKLQYVNVEDAKSDFTLQDAADVLRFETMLLDTDAYTRAIVTEGLVFIHRDGPNGKLEVLISNGDDSQHARNYSSSLAQVFPANVRYVLPNRLYRMPILNGASHGHQKSVRFTVAIETLVETGSIFTR